MGESMRKFILVFAVLSMLGCSARKKEVHKTETKLDYSAHFDSMAHLLEQYKSQALNIQATMLQQRNMHIDYDGAAGDSLEIKEFGPDGNVIGGIILKGKGKANIDSSQKKEEHKQQQTITTENKKDFNTAGSNEVSAVATAESLDKHVQSFNLSWLWWLLIIPAIWFLYSKGRKTYHKVKNLFTSNSQKI
jgi:hypothetical protein